MRTSGAELGPPSLRPCSKGQPRPVHKLPMSTLAQCKPGIDTGVINRHQWGTLGSLKCPGLWAMAFPRYIQRTDHSQKEACPPLGLHCLGVTAGIPQTPYLPLLHHYTLETDWGWDSSMSSRNVSIFPEELEFRTSGGREGLELRTFPDNNPQALSFWLVCLVLNLLPVNVSICLFNCAHPRCLSLCISVT